MTRGKTIDTAALLLIDGSSSMSGWKSQTVMRCAYFFADCLEKCSVATEVAVFQTSDSSFDTDYQVIKDFSERMTRAASRFSPLASGGTPMAEANVEAIRRMRDRREVRKILFILTDGQPNGSRGDPRSFMVRLADFAASEGIETIGLGVGTSRGVSQCFREFVMLDKTSSSRVEKNFIDLLQRRILST
jgi:uncharacterized protein YegL